MTAPDLENLASWFEREAHLFADRAIREESMSYRRGIADGKATAFGDAAYRLRAAMKEPKR